MANAPKFRTAYDLGPAVHVVDFGDEPSLAIQSAADECDINLIIERANRGILPAVNQRAPQFGDFSEVPDYQTAYNAVVAAQAEFEALPARVRERFGNDPAKLLSFLADPANREEAEILGLVDRPAVAVQEGGEGSAAPQTQGAAVVTPQAS